MLIISLIMDKTLHNWLSQYIRFDNVEYKPNLSDLVVDLFISDTCNLQCKHCYFGNTSTIGRLLSLQDWKNVIGALYGEGIRHFHISGRESSLDNRVLAIVSYIKSLDNTYSGLVSNGTGQPLFYRSLIDEGIDYLEFSIDGTEDTHNFVRGKNVFSQTISLLESLSEHSNIIDVSTCLNKNSIDEYFSIVDICLAKGIKKFFATPFLKKGNGKSFTSFSISPLLFSKLIENSFAFLESKPGQRIVLKYCVPHETTYSLIENSDFFRQRLVDYLTSGSEMIYHVNGNLIQISLNLLDVKFLHDISITSDGEVIPCSDYISDNDYTRYSIGNVVKTDLSTIIKARATSINNNLKNLQK